MHRVDTNRPTTARRARRWAAALVMYLMVPVAYADDAAEAGAMAALDRWMTAFNSRSMQAWSETLHYPHVRFARGSVAVYDTAAQFADRRVFEALAQNGWDRSRWVERDVTMSSPAKVHVETVFERFNKENESIGRYRSLYIMTKEDGRWAVRARSSLAP